ncbi:hypothetical protein H6F89_20215 [Cyanobacteria bacterium FACHB-63]|nr:hypothetical protein [Cyanobacteria bacterium FACHB-63]
MNDQIRQRAKEKMMQSNPLQENSLQQEVTPSEIPLRSLITSLELLQQLESQVKPVQALVEAVRNLTPESQLQPQLEKFQQENRSQFQQLNQQITTLNQRFQQTIPQVNLILEEFQESATVLQKAIPTLQQLIEQGKTQITEQQKQLDQITERVNVLQQPVPIKLNWLKIYGLMALFAISTGCTIVLMLRLLPATTFNLNQPNQPHQTQKKAELRQGS